MSKFEQSVPLPAPVEEAFRWHESNGAFERLTPPWEPVSVESRTGGIANGDRVVLKLKVGPVGLRWVAEHCGYDPPHKFEDRQVSGPFAEWQHRHLFESRDGGRSLLCDSVEYKLPLGVIGRLLGGRLVESKLQAMFAYRHRVTMDDLRFHQRYSTKKQRVAITGASGLVGSTLAPLLTTGGHEVVKISRSAATADDERQWDPAAAHHEPALFEGCDTVIHLAGETVLGRWTAAKKKRIRDSRVVTTRAIAETLAAMETGPKTLVVASATGFYGDRGDERLDENSEPGTGFLSDVCVEWESAADAARDAGIRVVHVRLGIVLSRAGGALSNMLLPFSVGLGGRVASGTQHWSWISIDDAAGIFAWAALSNDVEGVVNAVAPHAATNQEFTKTLGTVIRRPTVLPVPKFGVRLVFGEVANGLLLASTRVSPKRTLELGYHYRFDDLEEALRHQLGRA